LFGFARLNQGKVNDPPAFSNPRTWIHFHAMFDFFYWIMSCGSCDSRSHNRSFSPLSSFLLVYHTERNLVSLDGLWQTAQKELREETGFRAGKLEKPLDFYSHPGYIAHKVHLLVAYDLDWDPLDMEDGEEIWVHTFTLDEALAATREDYRCDPEAALAL